MSAWSADSASGERATVGWWCLPWVCGRTLVLHCYPQSSAVVKEINAHLLVLTQPPTQSPEQAPGLTYLQQNINSFLVEYRMFCWCSVRKVFPAAHSLLLLIWNISLFSGDILLYNNNLDVWNLPGMLHVSSPSEYDPLWWETAAVSIDSLFKWGCSPRMIWVCFLGRWILMKEKYLERMPFQEGHRTAVIITRSLLSGLSR